MSKKNGRSIIDEITEGVAAGYIAGTTGADFDFTRVMGGSPLTKVVASATMTAERKALNKQAEAIMRKAEEIELNGKEVADDGYEF